MKIAISILTAALATVPLTSSADTSEDEEATRAVAHHNTVFKFNMTATGDVINKFGQALRVTTWLEECKLDALAKAVTPTNDEIHNVVIQYLQKQPDGNKYLWDVLAGVKSSVFYYQIGFKETVGPIRKTLGENFCSEATKQANDLLRGQQTSK